MDGYYITAEEVISNGKLMAKEFDVGKNCRDDTICKNVACINGKVKFEAQHFDGFAMQSNQEAREGCRSIQLTVYAGFGLLAVVLIVISAFAIIHITDGELDFSFLMATAIAVIGVAVVILIGYIIISATGDFIC